MTTQHLTTGYVSVPVAVPDRTDTTAARHTHRYLPGGWSLHDDVAHTGPVAVTIALGTAEVTTDRGTVHLRLPAVAAASDTLAYVTYTALERVRQQQRMVTVHATALHTPAGRAVLLLGAKSAGKTSTALALAARGWIHAGDDLVVLGDDDRGSVTVWPGKPTAALRDPLHPLAPKPQHPLEPFATGPAPLAWIVRLAVHPALTATSLTTAAPVSVNERLRLHENLARYISGLPTPISGLTDIPYGPVWPLDTPALARWRSQLLTRLTRCRFDYLYAPDPGHAADLLAQEADAA
ncbi:hypothetical protein [Nocardia wallacei]|uniref:hypothetical protein n=1 Tax=Nocardia wallacei TaxID=480035 RepID=UPI0024540035|nr:hypothetical protein [Nocardia wallacei]